MTSLFRWALILRDVIEQLTTAAFVQGDDAPHLPKQLVLGMDPRAKFVHLRVQRGDRREPPHGPVIHGVGMWRLSVLR